MKKQCTKCFWKALHVLFIWNLRNWRCVFFLYKTVYSKFKFHIKKCCFFFILLFIWIIITCGELQYSLHVSNLHKYNGCLWPSPEFFYIFNYTNSIEYFSFFVFVFIEMHDRNNKHWKKKRSFEIYLTNHKIKRFFVVFTHIHMMLKWNGLQFKFHVSYSRYFTQNIFSFFSFLILLFFHANKCQFNFVFLITAIWWIYIFHSAYCEFFFSPFLFCLIFSLCLEFIFQTITRTTNFRIWKQFQFPPYQLTIMEKLRVSN